MKKPAVIPTILGILLLLGGVAAGILSVKQGQSWFLRAAPEEQPKEVRITNVTDTSFTVSWITDTKVRAFVKYGESGGALPEVALDEKDSGKSEQGAYDVHYVSVRGLTAESDYEFKLGSGKRLYDDGGKAFSIKTAPLAKTGVGETDLVTGSVTAGDGGSAAGAIVYLENTKLTPLSAMVKPSGAYTIPLSGARQKGLAGIYDGVGETEMFEMLVEGGTLGKATAQVGAKNRGNVPPIGIPGNYDFTGELPKDASGNVVLPTSAPVVTGAAAPTAVPGSKFSFSNLPTPTESDEITVIYPSVVESVNVTKPEFSGAAPPGKSMTITVQSTPQSQQVVADADGVWKWTPPVGLEPGEHTLTVSYVDKSGVLKKLVRKFVVSAEAVDNSSNNMSLGGALAFTATPSATLIPSATPTPGLDPQPTASATPTIAATPTEEVTPTMRAAMPATDSAVPTSGTTEVTIALVVAGFVMVGSGIAVMGSVKRKGT